MLELRGIYKAYENNPLLRGISLKLNAGETICLLGASGSGKSTMLRMIAGLEPPDSGKILWDGNDLASTPSHLRDFGLVFQDYALFPHLDVFDNVAFGLRMKSWVKDEIEKRVREVLSLVDMREFDRRNITGLSGGEQQRVALARAIAPGPRLLMFDEPLGALDRALRDELLFQVRRILHQTQIPAIYVTHDQDEAFTIADRILMLHNGLIEREGTPADVWANPDSAWAAEFLGLGNVIVGTCKSRIVKLKGWNVDTAFGLLGVKCGHIHKAGDVLHLLIRPLTINNGSIIRGRVTDVTFQQDRFKVTLDEHLFIYLQDAPKLGEKITVKVAVKCLG